MFCKFESDKTSDWLNHSWFSKSEVLLISNACNYKRIWRTKLRMNIRMTG